MEEIKAVIIEHYGDILFKLEQKQEAVNQWKIAKSIGEDQICLTKKLIMKICWNKIYMFVFCFLFLLAG